MCSISLRLSDSRQCIYVNIKRLYSCSMYKHNCDRVCIKGPFVGNLKNKIINFYDKLGFKASFPLISERNLLFLLY